MKRKVNLTHIVFALYILVLAWIILFKTAVSLEDIRMLAGERRVNFIPFYYDNDPNIRHHIKEVFLNLLIFVPFGVCLKMLGVTVKKGAVVALISTVCLEAVQFIFAIGGADITDVITNFSGAACGLVLFAAAAKIFKNEKKLCTVINVVALCLLIIFIALMALLIIANN